MQCCVTEIEWYYITNVGDIMSLVLSNAVSMFVCDVTISLLLLAMLQLLLLSDVSLGDSHTNIVYINNEFQGTPRNYYSGWIILGFVTAKFGCPLPHIE